MTLDGIIAEADKIIEAHRNDTVDASGARAWARRARREALRSQQAFDEAATCLAYAEVAHRGEGDVDVIRRLIRDGVTS